MLAYVDDVVLLAPSWYALQSLIKILERWCTELDIVCNTIKTVCMIFKPKNLNRRISADFPCFSLDNGKLAAILNFKKISIFVHVTVIGFNICCSVPNFIKIARFFILQNGVRPPSWICYDVTILHRRTHFRCPNIGLKFYVDRCYSFRDTCNIISRPFGNGPWQCWGCACTVSRDP